MLLNIVEIDEIIALVTCDQKVVIYQIKKGELISLWEMKHVENSDQTNEGNNEEGKRHLQVGTQHSSKIVH